MNCTVYHPAEEDSMSVTLYHHPWSRAATVVWMLEEVGVAYDLEFVDLMKGGQETPEFLALNPMGKVPVLTDGEAVVSEVAAIGVYLADRYATGKLAPALDDPRRGAYLRWCFFAPSVLEPGCMAKVSNWDFKPGSAGFGRYDRMIDSLEAAVSAGPWLLGDQFTMADVIVGATVRWFLQFKMIEPRPAFLAYAERLGARAALVAADARNAEVTAAHGLKQG
jgi:glutathione S-transferase